jgi:hypothetical protein
MNRPQICCMTTPTAIPTNKPIMIPAMDFDRSLLIGCVAICAMYQPRKPARIIANRRPIDSIRTLRITRPGVILPWRYASRCFAIIEAKARATLKRRKIIININLAEGNIHTETKKVIRSMIEIRVGCFLNRIVILGLSVILSRQAGTKRKYILP